MTDSSVLLVDAGSSTYNALADAAKGMGMNVLVLRLAPQVIRLPSGGGSSVQSLGNVIGLPSVSVHSVAPASRIPFNLEEKKD